jgi:hypothetical protein
MITLQPADHRRAAALIVHFGQGDTEGMAAIFREVNEDARLTELMLAVLSLYNEMVPEVRTQLGMSLLSSYVMRLAGMEDEQR